MNTDDVLAIIQDKFFPNDKVENYLLNCKLQCVDEIKKDIILVIVGNNGEKAICGLLCDCKVPTKFSDLTIGMFIPIDKHFKSEFDDKQSSSQITFSSNKQKMKVEMPLSSKVDDFLVEVFQSIDDAETEIQEFKWLSKYTSSSHNDTARLDPAHLIHSHQLFASSGMAIREQRIRHEMIAREDEYTNSQVFNIYVATWNVNGKSPITPLKDWLSVEVEPPDIYAIGFQELDLSKEALFVQTPKEDEWIEAVLAGIDPREKYIKIDKVRLVGMLLIVLIKSKHFQYVKNIVVDTVPTGILGLMGNKGGVAIRFDLHNSSICFVNSHLAAHVEDFERRNQDYRDISAKAAFRLQDSPPKGIKDHDHIYWLGDLNYRITDKYNSQTVKLLLEEKKISNILEHDQLIWQHSMRQIFVGYTEGPITFQPTYKYNPGTDEWDSSEKNRAPAWCDRILWKGENITQLAYRSHPKLNISDHKPVSATFNSKIKVIDEGKFRRIYEEVIKKQDKIENEMIPQVTVDQTEVDFNTIRYLEPQIRYITIANTGQVLVQFGFIKKLEETTFCKDWLIVEPYTACISPGEKCDVQLQVFVNKNSAYKFNAGIDQLYDILVLHLEGGKDIFITITGNYERSCFGSSIEALVNINKPIKEVVTEELIALESRRDQCSSSAYCIPKEIWFLVDHIYLHGLSEPNLFEQPGLYSEILLIRDWLDEGSENPIPGSIHSIAEALLLLLESTAEPIIPYNLHNVCLCASSNNLQCKQIVMQLPEYRRNVFLYICQFLREALVHSAKNGLDAKTLSNLFGSIFLRDVPNNVPVQSQTKYSKQISDRKKANFVYHFLISDQSDIIQIKMSNIL